MAFNPVEFLGDETVERLMTFGDAVTEICTRVNDPERDTYEDRAATLFVQAVCEIAVAEDTRLEEMQELLVEVDAMEDGAGASTGVSFAGTEASLDIPHGTLKVLDVFIDPEDFAGTTTLTLKGVTHNEIKRTKLEPSFLPTGDECFWYRVGNQIRFLLSKEVDIGSDILSFTVQTLVNPDSNNWGISDLVNDKGYSLGFLYRCIDNAVAKLRAEVV